MYWNCLTNSTKLVNSKIVYRGMSIIVSIEMLRDYKITETYSRIVFLIDMATQFIREVFLRLSKYPKHFIAFRFYSYGN